MRLSDIHFHDSVIYRIMEDRESDSLSFEVDYPVDWVGGIYERKVITFVDVLNYQIYESPFEGLLTFLDWSTLGAENNREVIRLETNAGYRQLAFKEVTLSNAT